MILLYDGPSESFFIIYFKSLFGFFRKGFFLLLLFDFKFSLWVLNVISSFIIHEVIHLYFARKDSGETSGYIAIDTLHFFASVPRTKTTKGAVLTYLSPSLMGLVCLVLFILGSCKEMYYLPWTFNLINIMPFSSDMRALFRNLSK